MSGYDAVVIGGGIVGLSTAYHLVREGARTLLVDRGDAGRATDAGAGILSTASDTGNPDPVRRFAALAAEDYPRLIERLAVDGAGETGYAVCGSLTVAVDADEAAALRELRARLFGSPAARAAATEAAGCADLTPERARELFPPLGDRVRGAIRCGRGARVDGRLLSGALRRAALGRGLEAREAAADGLVVRDGRVQGVMVGGETVAAGHVVIAAGAWSGSLGARVGVAIPVEPMRGQIAHLDLAGADTGGWAIVTGFRDHYIVPWENGRVAVGATREAGAGFEPRTTVAGVIEVLAEAVRVAPGLADASLREVRVGLRPASPDGLPILGPVPGLANLLLATGHGARGLQLGPYSGRVIARTIVEGDPGVDLSPFSLGRFG